jgi:hypothetical protein
METESVLLPIFSTMDSTPSHTSFAKFLILLLVFDPLCGAIKTPTVIPARKTIKVFDMIFSERRAKTRPCRNA